MFKKLKFVTVVIVATSISGLLAESASAQQGHGHRQRAVAIDQGNHYVDPDLGYHGPKIGIEAIPSYRGVEVSRTFWNTPASRLGLEPGDRILEINGHRVDSVHDLRRWLKDAVVYHNGQIRVLIDNVRARHGEPGAQRFVSHRTYLDGYAHLAGNFPGQPGGPGVITYETHNHQ